MKNKKLLALLTLALLVLVGLASSQSSRILPVGVEEITDCQTITLQEEQQVWENCAHPYFDLVCDDEPINSSCRQVLKHFYNDCQTGTRTVQKSKQECVTTGYNINNQVKVNAAKYGCSVVKDSSEFIVIL